ncbi:MAG TPA: trigger factor, partial [Candidatus Saccharibacteria bacterium]|nr:trigger factor [Candidatus Saccharibacteria bacterium]
MQVTRKDISDTKVKLTITLGLEELVHAKQHELQEQAKSVKVAGFRKGKAPLTVVEKQLDENQLQVSVINHAINDFYGKAVEEQKLRTLNQPDVTIGKFVPFTELEFVAEVEIMPKVKLGDYKKIKKTVAKVTVTEKDVEDVLSNLRSQMAEKKDSEKPAKKGDDVIIDFTGTDKEGKAVSGASGTDYSLNLGSNSFIPGFEDGLIGVKKGDTKELKLSFPKDYHAQTLAGTAITFNVTVMNVKSVTLPEVNDEFAAKVGPFKTAKELNADIKKQLEEQKQQEALNKMKDELVEELVKKSEFKLPEVLVNDQIAMLEQDFSQNLVYRGMTKAEYLNQAGFKDEEEWKKNELQPQAERRVSVGMVLAEVAEQEA